MTAWKVLDCKKWQRQQQQKGWVTEGDKMVI